MRRILKFVGIYLLLTVAVLVPVIVFELPRMVLSSESPNLPDSPKQWALAIGFLLLILPAGILLEGLGSWLHDNRATRYIEHKTRHEKLSGGRILYNLIYAGLIISIIVGLIALWRAIGW